MGKKKKRQPNEPVQKREERAVGNSLEALAQLQNELQKMNPASDAEGTRPATPAVRRTGPAPTASTPKAPPATRGQRPSAKPAATEDNEPHVPAGMVGGPPSPSVLDQVFPRETAAAAPSPLTASFQAGPPVLSSGASTGSVPAAEVRRSSLDTTHQRDLGQDPPPLARPAGIHPEVYRQILAATRDAKIHVLGLDLLKNENEGKLFIAFGRAYGGSPSGFIYIAPSRARSTEYPPDLVLCHPEVGLLVVEAKGHAIEQIETVEAGSFYVRYDGQTSPHNPLRQVEDQMFEIRSDILKQVRAEHRVPISNCMLALPRISEADWEAKGFHQAVPSSQLLFAEQLRDPELLKRRVAALVEEALEKSHRQRALTIDDLELIKRVFGNSETINESRPVRSEVPKETFGAYVDQMMAIEKYLSEEQKRLAAMSFEGSQRLVRGVAGSGKSVVLAMLVARYLHRKLDDRQATFFPAAPPKIAVTCFNTALVPFLSKKIEVAYQAQTLNRPIPEQVITAAHLNQLMFKVCREQGWPINYLRYEDYDQVPRAAAYRAQIAEFQQAEPDRYHALCFDALFIDEGQDFEPEEYRLLLDLVKPDARTGEKTIVIFYDDAQNLYGRARPAWSEVGLTLVGERTQVMRECFRNPRPVVELAFNVLLGAQAADDVRVQTRGFADVSYLENRGLVKEVGGHFEVGFAERQGESPQVNAFSSEQDELEWLAKEVVRLVRYELVRPEDLLILANSWQSDRLQALTQRITAAIPDSKFVQPFGKSQDKFQYITQPGKITISTVHGAKGYDAPIVFLSGLEQLASDASKDRAIFYVGATRAKLRLYLSGVAGIGGLLEEAQRVLNVMEKRS